MTIDQIIADYKAFAEVVKAKEKETFELLITTILKDNPTLKSIVVKGTTPSFNDGDPCYHSTEIMYPSEYESKRKDNIEIIVNYFDVRMLVGTVVAIEALVPNIEFTKEIISNSVEDVIQDLLEVLYGTNWIIIFYLDDEGKFAFNKAEYFCGY